MERMAMSKVREILRLRWEQQRSVREVARALDVSIGVVSTVTSRAMGAGLDAAMVAQLDDVALEERLYGRGGAKGRRDPERPLPDPVWVHTELRRPGVTLELLHLEYLEEHPNGYRYTAFCDVYRRWLTKQRVSMRQVHRGGERMFVDYSGKKPRVVEPATGEEREVELFVAVLGASSMTYAEATESQKAEDFVASHVAAFDYFRGVTAIVVPDQLRSAVGQPCAYEPGIARTYGELAKHYETAIVPARPGKPKDKAKVEVGVQIAQRWILARLRRQTFFSIDELNARIRELYEDLNDRPRKKLGGVTRRELYKRYDEPSLRPLPNEPFEVATWRQATVSPDYHVEVLKHWYSVPYQLVRDEVELRLTRTTLEVYYRGKRVAAHPRDDTPYRHTTLREHMPESHQRVSGGCEDIIAWASHVGPMTHAMVTRLLEANPIREQGWRSARGLKRVLCKYGLDRAEAACGVALKFGARSYKPIERILKLERDLVAHEDIINDEGPAVVNDDVRGPSYFH
jgi:transposase